MSIKQRSVNEKLLTNRRSYLKLKHQPHRQKLLHFQIIIRNSHKHEKSSSNFPPMTFPTLEKNLSQTLGHVRISSYFSEGWGRPSEFTLDTTKFKNTPYSYQSQNLFKDFAHILQLIRLCKILKSIDRFSQWRRCCDVSNASFTQAWQHSQNKNKRF